MTKKQFIDRLEDELIENNVKNINDILNEYENHFIEGKREGKTEDEICKHLGNPEMIAGEYTNKEEIKFQKKEDRKGIEKIIACILCCVILVVILIIAVPIISRKLDDRTITIVYDKNEISLMSVQENNVNDFRFLSEEVEVNKGDKFYLAIEQKEGYEVISIKINGKDRTNDLLSANDGEKLNNLPVEIKNFIKSNDNCVFIKIDVKDDIKIEIES